MEPSPERLKTREVDAIRGIHKDPNVSLTERFQKIDKQHFSYDQSTYEDAEGGVGISKSISDGLKSYLIERVPTDSATGLKFSELTDTSVALLYSTDLIQRIVVKNPEPALNSSFYASKLQNKAYKQNFTVSNLSFVQGFNQFKAARLEAKPFGRDALKSFVRTQDGPEEVERQMLKYLSDVSQELGNQ